MSDSRAEALPLAASDAELLAVSEQRQLNLNLAELRAIVQHFRTLAPQRRELGLPEGATVCELEVFAQTWSEHCKHKEFNAIIDMKLGSGQAAKAWRVDSLLKTYVIRATETIRDKYQRAGKDWVITAFDDNAGVARYSDRQHLVLKVETHNAPSAIEPKTGATTGLLGCQRDALGTGKGGARLIAGMDVLCFAPPQPGVPLLPGQLDPEVVARGVVEGIAAAGNLTGVPTVAGAVVYDRRYAAKPLVHCGTLALLPAEYPSGPGHLKVVRPGDRVVVVGGPTGLDGVHGATFSSAALKTGQSASVVPPGNPALQRRLLDVLERACARGLVLGCTDNGAGGLASSVGELAQLSGGAHIDVRKVPAKPGQISAWQLLLSESQERMTLAVAPEHVAAVLQLASEQRIFAADIGAFDASGVFAVADGGERVAHLDLGFLHGGVPRKHLQAQWLPPIVREPELPPLDLDQTLLQLLASPNIASREGVIRRYDHEVQGGSVLKPLMGELGLAPQDAAVLRPDPDSWQGLAIAHGICPKYGDLDPYEMAAGAFDEAVRALVSVGAQLPSLQHATPWVGCDNFCVPDSVYHPEHNSDGRKKLGALVRMAEALFDQSVYFDVPMISGKDSMKNDFRAGALKLSVPPTLLVTLVAQVPDVRHVLSSEWKAAGDLIYLVGATYDELGGSELYALFGKLGARVPKVRRPQAKTAYLKHNTAHGQGLLQSSHDLSDGGLAVALAECCIGAGLGAQVLLPGDGPSDLAWLFSESHSRLLVSVRPEHAAAFEAVLGDTAALIGSVTFEPRLRVLRRGAVLIDSEVAALTRSWHMGGLL
ncbi:MAG: phosphoribosylformylglycinamidine synthase [Deltaproteobacteria bacterium]|nr:phosphoribosylformylglycinamidine synthase [Deltaproteobacteria bacterium]